jgi:TupA-like ATPgrasp
MLDSALDVLRYVKHRVLRRPEGEAWLRRYFAGAFGRPLDLEHAETLTEKLFARMVSWNRRVDPKFTRLADKFAARSYVEAKIGGEYLTRLYWHGTDPAQIPFDALPAEYVIKSNHASGHVIVVRDPPPPDRADITKCVTEWLAENYYWRYREYQYYRIPPRILIEEYLSNPDGAEVLIHRFWCFDGVPRVMNVDNRSHTVGGFYDIRWNRLGFVHHAGRPRKREPEKPRNLELMVDLASRLSEGIDFVRLDLYNIGGRVLFNEYTFTPSAGIMHFDPIEWDRRLGEMWTRRD